MTEHENTNQELAMRDNDAEIDEALRNMQNIADESKRVADVAHNAPEILENLDKEFEAMTGLNKYDYAFMLLAAAIQCVRWYFLPNYKDEHKSKSETKDDDSPLMKILKWKRLTAKEGDKLMEGVLNKLYVPKKWQDILLASVPYDAIKGGADVGAGLGGNNHRVLTLGHDLIAGWIFGPVNILSDSLTKTDFTSFKVENMIITESISTLEVFRIAYEQTKVDKWNLPAAIARQIVHFGSDVFTKQGLPVPLIATIDPKDAETLFRKFHVDFWGVARSATIAGFINMCIAWLHRLCLYDPEKYSSPEVFEVKTRKIIRYSNVIATSSNVLYVAIGAAISKTPRGKLEYLQNLDAGGMLVTLRHLICDSKFQRDVKIEFISGRFNAMIRGEGYDFV